MPFLTGSDRGFAQAIAALVHANPFLPERIEWERAALGPDFVATGTLWHARSDLDDHPNLAKLSRRVEALAETLRGRLAAGARPGAAALLLRMVRQRRVIGLGAVILLVIIKLIRRA